MAFKGNEQKVWFNGKLLATLKKAEAKMALSYEEKQYCGTYETDYEYTGYKIDGTLTYDKVDSTILNMLKDAAKTGGMPEVTITGAILEQSTGGTERVNLLGVHVTEIMLMNAEAQKSVEEAVPFNARSYDVLETV